MTVMAACLALRGWHLHSGGAAGADSAFAAGAPPVTRTLYLPWLGYRGHVGPDYRTPSPDCTRRCLAIAAALHPAWHPCSPSARKLHARNVAVASADTDAPVDVVVAWTVGGAVRRGTGMASRIALDRRIPVLNLALLHPRAVCERLEEIRAAAPPAPATRDPPTLSRHRRQRPSRRLARRNSHPSRAGAPLRSGCSRSSRGALEGRAEGGKSMADIHLSEDHRGPVKVHDRARIRETAQRLVDTHPLW